MIPIRPFEKLGHFTVFVGLECLIDTTFSINRRYTILGHQVVLTATAINSAWYSDGSMFFHVEAVTDKKVADEAILELDI